MPIPLDTARQDVTAQSREKAALVHSPLRYAAQAMPPGAYVGEGAPDVARL